jgi:hypothetical protein
MTYTIVRAPNPSADETDAYQRMKLVMDGAIEYYTCFTNISKLFVVTYDPVGTVSASASIDGTIQFGSNRLYMTLRVAMHEIAHTVGMGTAPAWLSPNLNTAGGWYLDGVWLGRAANAVSADLGQTNVVINGQHFNPYGLQFEGDVTSLNDYISHCRMVMAFREDMQYFGE